jgi:tRNA(His) guanylyltransferase
MTIPSLSTLPKVPLAERMKSYEAVYDATLPLNSPVIMRLDGHNFSRFTSHFARPFDERIHSAMISTCTDLLSFFPSATVAYTQSDEITLIFPAGVGAFNERVQKLGSLAASYCSVHFVKHLMTCLEQNPEPDVKGGREVLWTAHFDARLFVVPSLEEALSNLVWRCRNDAVRNAVNSFARTFYSTKEMNGKRTLDLTKMLKEEKGVVFEDAVPRWAIEGCLLKREQFDHKGRNEKTGEVAMTKRTRVRTEERGVREFGEEGLRIVRERYW